MLRRYYGKISKLPINEFVGHDGELVVDDLTGRTYVMDGVTLGGHELVGATPRYETTPPTDSIPGALWYDPTSGRLYIYYNNQWVDAAPNATYTLPEASASRLGGIKIGRNLTIDPDGTLNAEDGNYILPIANSNVLGGVKIGNNIDKAIDGTITANLAGYATQLFVTTAISGLATETYVNSQGFITSIPTASESQLGVVKVDNNTIVINDGIISSVGSNSVVPPISTAPSNPVNGELWYDTNTGKIYVYLTDSWVDANPAIPIAGTAPVSPTSAGTQGQIAYDNSHVYVCVAPNIWKRSNLDTWS